MNLSLVGELSSEEPRHYLHDAIPTEEDMVILAPSEGSAARQIHLETLPS